jgi:hypothetical protein
LGWKGGGSCRGEEIVMDERDGSVVCEGS